MNNKSEILSVLAQARFLLGPEGPLCKNFPSFEMRDSQIAMLESVCDCYENDKITLIEAGTGTGKSIAYLIPAICWALETGEKTVISTGTIALQQQLIEKDIPFLSHCVGKECEVVLVKGMHNYICLRKLETANLCLEEMGEEEKRQFFALQAFAKTTQEGSRHELSYKPLPSVWEKVMVEAETCTHSKCPHFKECFFFQARKKAEKAQLVIVNHHLLFADLSLKAKLNKYEQQVVLPSYQRLIVDEAHHIEDVATEYFASKVSRFALVHTLGKLISEKGMGKLVTLRGKIEQLYPLERRAEQVEQLVVLLLLDLPAVKRKLVFLIDDLFTEISHFLDAIFSQASVEESAFRLPSSYSHHPLWVESIQSKARNVLEEGKSFLATVDGLKEKISGIKDAALEKGCENILVDIQGIRTQLEGIFSNLYLFIFEDPLPDVVRWVEIVKGNVHLIHATLAIGPLLKELLFEKMRSTLLCSATLSSGEHFTYIQTRLGIKECQNVEEKLYHSPFDFENQALLAAPLDIPSPLSPDFIRYAAELIWDIVQITQGGIFILFTSYMMLEQTKALLKNRLNAKRYGNFWQGEEERHVLLENFRKNGNGLLFGTDSFWEGVDVAGNALRCVIVTKLPFKVPTEPLTEARHELIAKEGGNPFFEYSLPQAVMKFKQGFGRLIRSRQDRGSVVCLDNRLVTKPYGKLFLRSLPKIQTSFEPKIKMLESLRRFYGYFF